MLARRRGLHERQLPGFEFSSLSRTAQRCEVWRWRYRTRPCCRMPLPAYPKEEVL